MKDLAVVLAVFAVLAVVVGLRAAMDLWRQGEYAFAAGAAVVILAMFGIVARRLKRLSRS